MGTFEPFKGFHERKEEGIKKKRILGFKSAG